MTADSGLRGAATRALALAGFDVIPVAHSGHATLAGLTAPRVDLLAADLSMADMSGPALATRLRRQHPGLRTVYFAEPGASECEGLLVRPFTRDELVTALRGAATSPPS